MFNAVFKSLLPAKNKNLFDLVTEFRRDYLNRKLVTNSVNNDSQSDFNGNCSSAISEFENTGNKTYLFSCILIWHTIERLSETGYGIKVSEKFRSQAQEDDFGDPDYEKAYAIVGKIV